MSSQYYDQKVLNIAHNLAIATGADEKYLIQIFQKLTEEEIEVLLDIAFRVGLKKRVDLFDSDSQCAR